jgi:hypothetical protein
MCISTRIVTLIQKLKTNPNTDGIVNCLLQPGQLRYQLFKSMLPTSIHLLNFRYHDKSCYRDKVSRAACQRAVGSIFCSPFIEYTMTSKLRSYYRDSYVISFYRDGTTCVHLPGLAKNSPTLTQTATYYTTEPLGCNNVKSSSARLPQRGLRQGRRLAG